MPPGYPNLATLINRISRLSQRWVDMQLRDLGIASAAVPVLALLASGEALTQAELVQQIGTEQPTMALLLKRMERDGLIVRSAHPEDGRSTHLSLTPAAIKKLPAAERILAAGYGSVTQGFSKSEMLLFGKFLKRYMAHVEQLIDEKSRR